MYSSSAKAVQSPRSRLRQMRRLFSPFFASFFDVDHFFLHRMRQMIASELPFPCFLPTFRLPRASPSSQVSPFFFLFIHSFIQNGDLTTIMSSQVHVCQEFNRRNKGKWREDRARFQLHTNPRHARTPLHVQRLPILASRWFHQGRQAPRVCRSVQRKELESL